MSAPYLCAAFSDPLWSGNSAWLATFDLGQGEYTHEIRRMGGYWEADIVQRLPRSVLEGWVQSGLGRHCVVYDDALNVCWEGFVDSLIVQLEDETIQVGPLTEIANRVTVRYSPLLTITDPPVKLDPDETTTANDTDSQARWGIWPRVFDAGDLTDTAADQVRDMRLTEWAWPATTRRVGVSQPLTLSLHLLGYVHLLRFPYSQTANFGDLDLSDATGIGKLQLILAADLNSLISTDYSRTTDNTVQDAAYEDRGADGFDIIKEMVALGDAALNAYNFGIYAGRVAEYAAVSDSTSYVKVAGDVVSRIYTPAQQEVKPWNVLPGRWLFHSSFVVGQQQPSLYATDSRFELLEWVRFRAPYGIEHQGGRAATVDQVLATQGLSGVYT